MLGIMYIYFFSFSLCGLLNQIEINIYPIYDHWSILLGVLTILIGKVEILVSQIWADL